MIFCMGLPLTLTFFGFAWSPSLSSLTNSFKLPASSVTITLQSLPSVKTYFFFCVRSPWVGIVLNLVSKVCGVISTLIQVLLTPTVDLSTCVGVPADFQACFEWASRNLSRNFQQIRNRWGENSSIFASKTYFSFVAGVIWWALTTLNLRLVSKCLWLRFIFRFQLLTGSNCNRHWSQYERPRSLIIGRVLSERLATFLGTFIKSRIVWLGWLCLVVISKSLVGIVSSFFHIFVVQIATVIDLSTRRACASASWLLDKFWLSVTQPFSFSELLSNPESYVCVCKKTLLCRICCRFILIFKLEWV